MAAKRIYVKKKKKKNLLQHRHRPQITAYTDHFPTCSVDSSETLLLSCSADRWVNIYCQPLQPIQTTSTPLCHTVHREPHKEFAHNLLAESHLIAEGPIHSVAKQAQTHTHTCTHSITATEGCFISPHIFLQLFVEQTTSHWPRSLVLHQRGVAELWGKTKDSLLITRHIHCASMDTHNRGGLLLLSLGQYQRTEATFSSFQLHIKVICKPTCLFCK